MDRVSETQLQVGKNSDWVNPSITFQYTDPLHLLVRITLYNQFQIYYFFVNADYSERDHIRVKKN